MVERIADWMNLHTCVFKTKNDHCLFPCHIFPRYDLRMLQISRRMACPYYVRIAAAYCSRRNVPLSGKFGSNKKCNYVFTLIKPSFLLQNNHVHVVVVLDHGLTSTWATPTSSDHLSGGCLPQTCGRATRSSCDSAVYPEPLKITAGPWPFSVQNCQMAKHFPKCLLPVILGHVSSGKFRGTSWLRMKIGYTAL